MSVVGKRIHDRRIELGLSADAVAEKLGKNRATIYRYEGDEIENMPLQIVGPLSEILNVSPAYLMGWTDEIDGGSSSSVTPASNVMNVRDIPMRRIPVIGDIAAGVPIVADQDYDDYTMIPQDNSSIDFALRVTGDSMEPFFLNGDLVYIRQQDDVEDGQIAAVCLDDTATLKHVYHIPNGIQLISENRKYPPMIFTFDDCESIRILGLAVRFERDIE